MGNTTREKQVFISPESNSMGTELPEIFFGETTESKETNGAIDNGRDRKHKVTKYHWIMKIQSNRSPNLQAPEWELVKDDATIQKFSGRISGYNPLNIHKGCMCWARDLSPMSMGR